MDDLAVESILKLMNDEDRRVPVAISEAMPEIVAATEVLVETWRLGGRWIYVGAGTSGRIAALDAAECPPTFGVPSERVLAVVAGGDKAAAKAMERVEDDREMAIRDLESQDLRPEDAVVGLTASGRTPYAISAIQYASDIGCSTVGICNNPGSELAETAQIGIEVITGPEVLTGSTRLKAGTSQKLVLNMLSTAAFTRLGKVYENLMVDVQATNEKLRSRARRIVCEAIGVGEEHAGELLLVAEGSVKLAIVMSKGECSLDEARTSLEKANGNTRQALSDT
jgi:N-acetylmuramic acid 6-phosphate etherase